MCHEMVEVLVVKGVMSLRISEDGVLGDDLLGLGELGVDPGQLVDGGSYAEAGDVCRQQLIVQGVVQNVRLAFLPFPVGVGVGSGAGAVGVVSGGAVLVEMIAVVVVGIIIGGGTGLTLGREPVVVEGGGVEPSGGGGCGGGRLVVVEGGGGGGGRVVVVEGHILGEVVRVRMVVVLKGHRD